MRRQKFLKHEPQFIANWMLEKQLGLRKAKQVEIRVFVRRMRDEDYGQCRALGDGAYRITINSLLKRTRSIETIAHEVQHVVQYVTGQLKEIDAKRVLWQKREMPNINDGSAAYFNNPWEKDARSVEQKLKNAYLRHLRKRKKLAEENLLA